MSEKIFPVVLYPNERPHKYQKELHYWASQPEIKTVTLILPRQNGKSTALRNELIKQLIDPMPRHGKKSIKALWITPVESQGILSHQMLEIALAPLIKSTKRSHGQFEITLRNNSRVMFKPSSSEGIKGNTIDLLIIDEMQSVQPEHMSISINPVLLANRNALTIVAGTPEMGTANILYDYARREERFPGLGFKTIHCTIDNIYTDYPNPKIDIDKVLAEKATMTADMFDAVYRGFFKSAKAFFRNVREQAIINELHEPIDGISYYVGIDVGIVNDATVITIVNEFSEMVHCRVLQGDLFFPEIVEEVKSIMQKWKPKFVCIEKNNNGIPLYHQLLVNDPPFYNIEVIDMIHSTQDKDKPTKSKLIIDLATKLEQNKIKLLNRKDVIEEFEFLECKTSPKGYKQWSAPYGKHDDIVISTCIAFYCLEKFNKAGEYSWAVI